MEQDDNRRTGVGPSRAPLRLYAMRASKRSAPPGRDINLCSESSAGTFVCPFRRKLRSDRRRCRHGARHSGRTMQDSTPPHGGGVSVRRCRPHGSVGSPRPWHWAQRQPKTEPKTFAGDPLTCPPGEIACSGDGRPHIQELFRSTGSRRGARHHVLWRPRGGP